MTGGAEITYVGHGSVLVAMDGVVLLTDPLLRRFVAHLRRAVSPVGELPRPGRGARLPPARRPPRPALLAAPWPRGPARRAPGAAQYLERRRLGDVTEVRPGDEVAVGPVTVRATYADHAGTRTWRGSGIAVGYMLEGSRRVYFAGDTDVFPEMVELGPVDVALLPIWGWGPSLGPGHLDPTSAARAAALLAARVVVPIHWGTYAPAHMLVRSRPAFLDDPPGRFRTEVASAAPDAEVRVLAPGESTSV